MCVCVHLFNSCMCILVFFCVCLCVFLLCVCVRVHEYACTSNEYYDYNICSCLFDACVAWEAETARCDHFMGSLHNDTHTQRRAHTHTHTYIDTLMRTHHSFAAHGSEEIRENAKRRKRQGGEKPRWGEQKDGKEKKKKRKRGIYRRSSFIWLISCFFPEAVQEKEKPRVSCWINTSTITIP